MGIKRKNLLLQIIVEMTFGRYEIYVILNSMDICVMIISLNQCQEWTLIDDGQTGFPSIITYY